MSQLLTRSHTERVAFSSSSNSNSNSNSSSHRYHHTNNSNLSTHHHQPQRYQTHLHIHTHLSPHPHSRRSVSPVSPLLPSEALHPLSAYNNDAGDELAPASPYLVSPIMSRTPSVAASDRYSAVSGVTGYWPQNPDNVTPAAAYVAPFGAVQVVNEHNTARRSSDASDFQDAVPHTGDAQFSPDALALINHFLDQLLYSILSTARSTNLHALRPAVTEVLRHRLAKEAVANADEELQELLAGGEEEEESNALSQAYSKDGNPKWDLELVWKRTRLRVMVYMRLGEMEDDDEERFVKEQELFSGRELDTRRFSSSSGLVSWSAAIFLTSVLEYVAEESLKAAGTAVYARARRTNAARPPGSAPQQIRVEDFDVEKLALDTRLGRLWRTWRKSQRPMTPNHRALGSRTSFSRDRAASLSALRGIGAGHSRNGSMSAEEQSRAARQQYIHGMGGPIYDDSELEYPEHVLASNIPLPMRDAKRDIDEIEVPGLATWDEENTEEPVQSVRVRRNSFTSPTTENFPDAAKSSYFPFAKSKPLLIRQRSKSVPNPMRTPKFEMPGAFPTEPEDDEAPSGETEDAVPEEKASAVEMQDDREQSKVLLNGVDALPGKSETREASPSSSDPVHENKELASEDKPQDAQNLPTSDSKDDDHPNGILSAVAAGATAVATAAAVATGYAVHHEDLVKQERDGEPKSMKEDFVQSREQATESSEQPLSRPKDRSPTEIEALDREKTKADLKPVVAAESTSPETIAVETEPDDVPHYYRSHHSASRTSNKLEASDQEKEAEKSDAVNSSADHTDDEALQTSRQDLKRNASNRADATTMAALEAPRPPSGEMSGVRPEPKARDMPMIGLPRAQEKPGRLIITGEHSTRPQNSSPLTVSTGNSTQPSSKNPREYMSRNKSSNSEAPPSATRDHAYQSPNEKTRAHAPRPLSSAATTPTSPLNAAKNRDSRVWHSPKEQMSNRPTQSRSISSSHHTQNSRGEVQDHPAINSMATPKRDAMVATASESGNSTPPVVSASIRGPKDFDNFLQGGDTVKYTLTPENVRDERPLPPTGEGKLVTKQTSHAASLAKLSGSGQATDGASSSSSLRKNSTSAQSQRNSRSGRSQSIKDVVASIKPQRDAEATREWRRSVAKPIPRNTSTSRRSGLMAREPQVMTASTRDFADFIRSTGPDREPTVQRLHTNRSIASLHSLRNAQKSQSGDGEPERTKSLTHITMAEENIPPVPKVPAAEVAKGSGSKGPPLEARSATGAASGNKDLINFIRDGPEEEGSHRISRSVAPFRNTMDSDQFDTLVESASKAPSKSSTTANSISAPPTRSTSMHRTIPSTNGSSSALPAQASQTSRHAPTDSDGDAGGGRTRYRNKDPYAIPSDSEDDEDEADILSALPRKNQRPQEESLAEFLRSQEPPANNSPRPIGGAAADRMSKSQTQQEPYAARTKSTQAQANGPQPVSTTSTPGSKPQARVSRIPRGNAGARLGAYEQTNTGDLAEFLRSSGPEEEAAPRRQQFSEPPKIEKKKSGFFSRLAGKREKV
jgi:hypothetical protein